MEQRAYEIIKKNLQSTTMKASASAEKAYAHLYELSDLLSQRILEKSKSNDLLEAVLFSENIAAEYRDCTKYMEGNPSFAPVNADEESYFAKQTSNRFHLYLCKCIAAHGKKHTAKELTAYLGGALQKIPENEDKKIAFLRNRQASRAFEVFAKLLGGVSASYETNFQNVCDTVTSGNGAYAIIPIYSTSDGRLNGFYRMIEKYELHIVAVCDIDSDDGETTTTFALVHKNRLYYETPGLKFECKITFDDFTSLSDIADAAFYYGVSMERADSLPVMFSGRNGTVSFVFDLTTADADGFLCYLALNYPQISCIGVYGKTGV